MYKKGTPEYEAWILTPEYGKFCKKQSKNKTEMRQWIGENNPNFGNYIHGHPRRGTPEYEAWILTPEYKEYCELCSRNAYERIIGLPRKGTPKYEVWILTPEYKAFCMKTSERMKKKGNLPKHKKGTPEYEAWILTPEYTEIYRKVSDALTGIVRSEETRARTSESKKGKPNPHLIERNKSEKHRELVSNTKRGKNYGLVGKNASRYIDGRSFEPYCEKNNKPFKRRVRTFQKNQCALCGHVWKSGEVALTVHHIHARKDSCCNDNAPRDFVCLCSRKRPGQKCCHAITIGKEELFVPRFLRYLLKNFDGKSYFTEEEYVEYMEKEMIK